MKGQVFWKSVIRRKGSLLLLLLLIAASSFGFMLRAVEYLTVSREIDRIAGTYRPIGSLSSPNQFVTEGVPLVEESPYVESVDKQRCYPAVLSDLYNADLDGYSSEFDMGDSEYAGVSNLMAWGEVVREVKTDRTVRKKVKTYLFRIVKGVCGYPEYTEEGMTLIIELFVPKKESAVLEPGKTYLIKGYPPTNENGGSYYDGKLMYVRLLELEDGLWFLEGEPKEETAQYYIDMDPEAEIQERNRHTMLVYTTADMSAMPLVQEASRDFYLEKGRWLDRRDQEEGNRVCVVAKEFAEVRGLKVGDSLTMTIQDRIPYWYGYAAPAKDTWETSDKTEASFKIVGIYRRLYGEIDYRAPSSDSNIIYIPDSCVPGGYMTYEETDQSLFSFVLKDPKETELFKQEIMEQLEPLGLSVTFVENNWDSFYHSAESIRQGTVYGIWIFGAVLLLALGAAAFLYTWQRKQETAIARALGVPAGRAAVSACMPMLVLGAAGILTGGYLAWNYGQAQAQKTLAALDAGSRTGLPYTWFAGICLLVWLLFALVLLGWSAFHAAGPVLAALQGRQAGRRKKHTGQENRKRTAAEQWNGKQETAGAFRKAETGVLTPGNQTAVSGGKLPPAVLSAFIGRHVRRFSLRSVFVLLAASVFPLASCWLGHSITSGEAEAERLYRSVAVEADITKKEASVYVTGHGGAYIPDQTIQKFLDTGFIRECTLVAGAEGYTGKTNSRNQEAATFLGTADIEQFLAQPGTGYEICYGGGYGPELFEKDYTTGGSYGKMSDIPAVILPEGMAEALGVEAGDQLFVRNSRDTFGIEVEVAGVYREDGGVVLAPVSLLETLEGGMLYYTTASFVLDPEKNREIEDFQTVSQEIIKAPGAGLQALSFVIWDGELRRAVEPMEKNIALMKILYPIANAVSFLAAAGLSVLFLFQRRREAAVLRVLGVQAVQTRVILGVELLAVDVTGMLAGAVLAVFLTGSGGVSAIPLAAGCYLLGCLAGTVLGTVLVTNGRPLELLQEKE